jgi:hypothetical protein
MDSRPHNAANQDVELEDGMVLCVETPCYQLGWGGMMVEDMIVIRPRANEYLMHLPPASCGSYERASHCSCQAVYWEASSMSKIEDKVPIVELADGEPVVAGLRRCRASCQKPSRPNAARRNNNRLVPMPRRSSAQ